MALAKTVTKMFPTANTIGINLVITDDDRPDLGAGAQVVISGTIERNLPSAEIMADEIAIDIGKEAQRLINSYKSLRAKYDKPDYGTKVSQIDSALKL